VTLDYILAVNRYSTQSYTAVQIRDLSTNVSSYGNNAQRGIGVGRTLMMHKADDTPPGDSLHPVARQVFEDTSSERRPSWRRPSRPCARSSPSGVPTGIRPCRAVRGRHNLP
jgi:hypothetical protein